MRPIVFQLAAAAAVAFVPASAAKAETVPRWEITGICGQHGPNAKCPRIESVYRRSVFDRWESQPPADRAICLKAIDVSGKRSFQRLLNCLEDRALETLDAVPHGGATLAPSRDG